MKENGTFELLPKKEVAKLELEMEKLDKYLGGEMCIRDRVTGAVDFQRISEAAWVGIPLHKEAMGLFAIDGSPEFISALFTICLLYTSRCV